MDHVKTFEGFLHESEIEATLYEASHAGRAWSGKIKNIDNLMSWMYDKGIINKTEQAEKDRIFREYYRYYNDGDMPRGMQYASDDKVEEYIERKVEEFIKKVLAKYTGKFDRRDFRIDTLLGDLNTLDNIVGGHEGGKYEPDPHGLLTYWGKNIKTGNSDFEKMLGELQPMYDDARKEADSTIEQAVKNGVFADESSYNIPSKGHNLSYVRQRLQDVKAWTPTAEKKYMKMKEHMLKMSAILKNVIEATQKLKQETGV
jgi:hypothetical protein